MRRILGSWSNFGAPFLELQLLESNTMYRIVGKDGQQYGPVSAEQVRAWIAENRANAQTLVQTEGAQDWKPLGSLAEFAGRAETAAGFGCTPDHQPADKRGIGLPA